MRAVIIQVPVNFYTKKAFNLVVFNRRPSFNFPQNLQYEYINETFGYGTIDLLCDIGGTLSLLMGASLLTCCELLEIASVSVFKNCCCCGLIAKRPSSPSVTNKSSSGSSSSGRIRRMLRSSSSKANNNKGTNNMAMEGSPSIGANTAGVLGLNNGDIAPREEV